MGKSKLRSLHWTGVSLFCAILGCSAASSNAQTPPALAGSQAPAMLATCVACHGAMGQGDSSGVPRLAGKDPEYLAHALSMFKDGTRVSPVMQPVAQGLSETDMQSLANYFSPQHPPRILEAASKSSLVEAGRHLAESGGGPDVPACFSCHGVGGKGNGKRFPAIAAEPAAFTVERLHAFQLRAKSSKLGPGSMTFVASKMNEAQIAQAAAYLSQIDP
jgi:cytochrome c553